MVGVSSVLRLIGATLALIIIAWVASVGFALFDAIYNDVIDPQKMKDLGWGAPQDTVMLFAALAFAGLTIVIVIWYLVAPVRDDVRQEIGGPPI